MNSPAPRSLAHESPGVALAFGRGMLATALMTLVGCADIAVSRDRTFEEMAHTTQRQNFSPWQREVTATTTGGRVVIQTKESRQCDVLTTHTGEQVTTVYRTNETVHLTRWLAAIGVVGAGVLTWGMDQKINHGKSLSAKDAEGHDTLSGPGYAVFLGGVGSLGLLHAGHAAIASWDTSSSEPWRETSNQRQQCDQRPVAAARVQVLADEQVLAEGSTAKDGGLSLPCLAEQLELLGERPEVRLNGARLPAQPLPQKYGFASFGVPGAAASNPQLELFRLPLAHARRSDVVAAVLRAGAKQLEEDAHVTTFDVASLAWPHATTLKTLFDGHDLFVKAHWEGDYAGTKQTEVLVALREQFGEPTRIHRKDGALVLRWAFADGLEVHYSRPAQKDSATCPLAELTFVDPVGYTAFETAVNAGRR